MSIWTFLRPLYRKLLSRWAEPKHFRMSLREWLIYHQREIVFDRNRWMGVTAYKNPMDAWILQEILYEVRPDVVVEIGSAVGGSTLYLAHLLDLLGSGLVVSIDIDRSRFVASHDRIRVLTGESASRAIVEQVAEICRDKRALVIHDGDHRSEAVLRDLQAYARFVSVGSYLIVEDGIIDLFTSGDGIGTPGPGPLVAIKEFLRQDDRFVIDQDRERYLLTYNPSGFLKRVR